MGIFRKDLAGNGRNFFFWRKEKKKFFEFEGPVKIDLKLLCFKLTIK